MKPSQTLLISLAVASLAMGLATEVAAQSAMDRAEARRARHAQKSEGNAQQVKPAAQYPNASREEPEAKASAKNSSLLKKMFDAYDKDDVATTTKLADEVIGNPAANAYEHAIAARIAGASLLNSDDARSAAYLKRALDFNGLNNNEHYESMLLLAQLQLQQQSYAESLATIDKFLAETKSQSPEHLVIKGNALYRLERFPEATAMLKQAVQTTPNPKPEWLQLLMGAYAEMGQPEEAAKLAEQVGAANPNDKQAQLNLAATYMQAGQDDKALVILEKLRSSGELKNETDYRNLYAMYLNAEGKEAQGIAVINEGLEKGLLKPDYQTYNALGQAYFFSEQTPQAIDAYTKAAPLAPDGEAYLNLARILNNEGRASDARKAAEQALAKGVKKPDDAKRIIANNK